MKRIIPILIIIILSGCKTNVDNWSTIEISGKVETKDIKYIIFYLSFFLVHLVLTGHPGESVY